MCVGTEAEIDTRLRRTQHRSRSKQLDIDNLEGAVLSRWELPLFHPKRTLGAPLGAPLLRLPRS